MASKATNTEPILVEQSVWKGTPYMMELYASPDFSNLSPITQVQAVCFDEDGSLVFYRHVDGFLGLPGGSVEEGEDLKDALAREIREEIASELLTSGPICYAKVYKVGSPEKVDYNVRYWAEVKMLDKPVDDPVGKAVERVVVSPEQAVEKLGWGKKGKILIALAMKERRCGN